MKYKSLEEQNEMFINILKQNKDLMIILDYIDELNIPNYYIATVHAIGITKENNKIKVYAPYGLSDIFSKTIRPIKHKANSKDLYESKVKSWKKRFIDLNIIEW